MATVTKMVRKFTFKDLSLAFKVREKVWNALVHFDQNDNQLFESNEIRKALVDILNEDQMEVQYVVKNVFRYDTDGDNAVTYTQFTNFCVEQHFGEMAIQRLHRMGYYQNGASRVMNLPQFQATLNYCLETINAKGIHNQYDRLFKEVDLDHDGVISYQDYFIFLRQYFGSQSQAFEQQQKNPRPPPPRKSLISSSDSQQRFCRLIYNQFKISVMQKDRNRNMVLQKQEIEEILSYILRLPYQQISKLKDKCMNGQNAIQYEKFIRIAVVEFMSDLGFHKGYKEYFNQLEFVQFVMRVCQFVQIKPSQDVIKNCFKEAARGASSLSLGDYSFFMKHMFQNYKFDTRGLPSYHSVIYRA